MSEPALAAPFSDMLDSFLLARQDMPAYHKSRHWDVFGSDYAELIANPALWPDFRNNGLSDGFDARTPAAGRKQGIPRDPMPLSEDDHRKLVTFFQNFAWVLGVRFMVAFAESRIGNPPSITYEGHLLDENDLGLIRFLWRLEPYLRAIAAQFPNPLIVEIGAGYGGLALKIKRMLPQARIVLFDLPEVNAVQHYYLSQALPQARLLDYRRFREQGLKPLEEMDFDIAILPGSMMSALSPQSAHLAINTCSMMEMPRAVIAEYFTEIQRVLALHGLFYCVNRLEKRTAGEPIRLKEYPYDRYWGLVSSQNLPGFTELHELVTERVATPPHYPLSLTLNSLQPFQPHPSLQAQAKPA